MESLISLTHYGTIDVIKGLLDASRWIIYTPSPPIILLAYIFWACIAGATYVTRWRDIESS